MAHSPFAQRSRSLSTLLAVIASVALAGCRDTNAPASPGIPATLQIVSGDVQSATVGQDLPGAIVVRALDAANRPVAGFPVRFRVLSGGGALNTDTAITDAQGMAANHWTLGTSVADIQSVRASVLDDLPRDAFIGVDFKATPLADVPAQLVALEGSRQISVAGTTRTDSILVRVTDRFDNPLSGIAVTWTLNALAGSLNTTEGVTSAAGFVSTRWRPGPKSGSYSGSVTAANGASLAFTSVVLSAAPAQLVVESGDADPLTTDSDVPVVMRLTDIYGNPVDGVPVDFTVEGSGTSVDPTRDVTDAEGRARTTWSTGSTEGPIALYANTFALEMTLHGQVVRDAPPVLTVVDPYDQYVACPMVELAVTCSDDNPAGCKSVTVSVGGRTLFTGTASAIGTISLEDYEGTSVTLVFTAIDSRGQTARAERNVYVESNMRLQKRFAADGPLIDYLGGRLLHSHATATGSVLAIRQGTSDVEIPMDDATSTSDAILTPTGALVVGRRTGAIFSTLFEWRNGALSEAGGVDSPRSVVANASFAIYGVRGSSGSETRLFRRDLSTGADVEVAFAAGEISNGVAENGDVVFWKGDHDIYRYRNGVTTRLTNDDDSRFLNSAPLTDGLNVVFKRQSATGGGYEIVLHDGEGAMILAAARAQEPIPNQDFAVNGGWSAFTQPDAAGVLQLWTRSPDGALRKATSLAVPSRISALGNDGAVVITAGKLRYLVEPNGAPENVSSDLGRVIWRDGEFLMLLGRMPFLITR